MWRRGMLALIVDMLVEYWLWSPYLYLYFLCSGPS
jgi:hypothetical protein